MNSIKIEIAGEQDSEVIREIYQTAFPEEESAMVAKLAVDLLAEKTVPEILSLVAREIETTLGHDAFSPVEIENNEPSFTSKDIPSRAFTPPKFNPTSLNSITFFMTTNVSYVYSVLHP